MGWSTSGDDYSSPCQWGNTMVSDRTLSRETAGRRKLRSGVDTVWKGSVEERDKDGTVESQHWTLDVESLDVSTVTYYTDRPRPKRQSQR